MPLHFLLLLTLLRVSFSQSTVDFFPFGGLTLKEGFNEWTTSPLTSGTRAIWFEPTQTIELSGLKVYMNMPVGQEAKPFLLSMDSLPPNPALYFRSIYVQGTGSGPVMFDLAEAITLETGKQYVLGFELRYPDQFANTTIEQVEQDVENIYQVESMSVYADQGIWDSTHGKTAWATGVFQGFFKETLSYYYGVERRPVWAFDEHAIRAELMIQDSTAAPLLACPATFGNILSGFYYPEGAPTECVLPFVEDEALNYDCSATSNLCATKVDDSYNPEETGFCGGSCCPASDGFPHLAEGGQATIPCSFNDVDLTLAATDFRTWGSSDCSEITDQNCLNADENLCRLYSSAADGGEPLTFNEVSTGAPGCTVREGADVSFNPELSSSDSLEAGENFVCFCNVFSFASLGWKKRTCNAPGGQNSTEDSACIPPTASPTFQPTSTDSPTPDPTGTPTPGPTFSPTPPTQTPTAAPTPPFCRSEPLAFEGAFGRNISYPCSCCTEPYEGAVCEGAPDPEGVTSGIYEVACHYNVTDGSPSTYNFRLHVTNPAIDSEVEVCGGEICWLENSIVNCTNDYTEFVNSTLVRFYNSTSEEWCDEETELVTFAWNTPEPTSKPTRNPTEEEGSGFVGWFEKQSEIVLILGGLLIFIILCLILVCIRQLCCARSKGGGGRGYSCLKTVPEEPESTRGGQTQGQFHQQQHTDDRQMRQRRQNNPIASPYRQPSGEEPIKNFRGPPRVDGEMPRSMNWPQSWHKEVSAGRRVRKGEGSDRGSKKGSDRGSRRGRRGPGSVQSNSSASPRRSRRQPRQRPAGSLRSEGEPDHSEPNEPSPRSNSSLPIEEPRQPSPRSNSSLQNEEPRHQRGNRAAPRPAKPARPGVRKHRGETVDDDGWRPPTDNDTEEREIIPGLRAPPKPSRSLRESFHEMDVNDSGYVLPVDFSFYMMRNFGCTKIEAVALFHDMDHTVSDQISVEKMERWMDINHSRFPKCRRTFSALANRWLRAYRRTKKERSNSNQS